MSMKKAITQLLVVMTLFSLTACSYQSENAKAADELINAIGEVTLDSKEAIDNATIFVATLSQEDIDQIRGLDKLEYAKNRYDALIVEDAIDKLGNVTLDNADKVLELLNQYDKLSDEAKKLVSNYDKLTEAEKQVDDVIAKIVVEDIDAIGTVDVNSGSKITAAEEAYRVLGDDAKKKVTNYSKLTAARAEYEKALEKEYKSALSRLNKHVDEVQNASFYTHKHQPEYTNQRCSILPYIAANESTNLRLMINYADDDWVFFKSVIFAVDDKRYTETYNYYDITHDSGGGMVGEYVDVVADKDDIKMLREIADSKKTIVRFQGDDHSYDYTLTKADKDAIKDVLLVYDHMVKNSK